MGMEKILKDPDFCPAASLWDRPCVDQDDPSVGPFLACPERMQEYEISHIAGHDCALLDAGECQEFSIGRLVVIRAAIEDGNHIVPTLS